MTKALALAVPEVVRIEFEPLGEIRRAKKNPKEHDLQGLMASFTRYGFVAPAIRNEKTGETIAGNGRLDALVLMKAEGREPPKRIDVRKKDGEWMVPIVRGISFASDAEAEEYLIADNQWTIAGGWNEAILIPMLKRISERGQMAVQAIGYPEAEIRKLAARHEVSLGEKTGKTDPDYIPPPAKKVVARDGDLWTLGQHRLLCGDSTDAAAVKRLLGSERIALLETDPPYGIGYVASKAGIPVSGFKNFAERYDDIEGDAKSKDGIDVYDLVVAMFKAFAPWSYEGLPVYTWTGSTDVIPASVRALVDSKVLVHRNIIAWVKNTFVLSHSGMYHSKFETCFYGWFQGKMPAWYGDKSQSNVWEVNRDAGAYVHPTQKPVEVFKIPMRNHTKAGDICFEPFSGSGSQIIAGEILDRRVFAIEKSAAYVDAAVRRWEAFTGMRANREKKK